MPAAIGTYPIGWNQLTPADVGIRRHPPNGLPPVCIQSADAGVRRHTPASAGARRRGASGIRRRTPAESNRHMPTYAGVYRQTPGKQNT